MLAQTDCTGMRHDELTIAWPATTEAAERAGYLLGERLRAQVDSQLASG
jgi:hypothetical protein